MESTALALLNGIDSSPGDAAPKLIFADYLEENGQEERARLIRLLAKDFGSQSNYSKHQVRALAGQAVMQAICAENKKKLGKPTIQFFHSGGDTSPIMIRGVAKNGFGLYAPPRFRAYLRHVFVTDIKCLPNEWVEFGPSIVRDQPINDVEIAGRKPYWNGAMWYSWHKTIDFTSPALNDAVIHGKIYPYLKGISRPDFQSVAYPSYSSAISDLSKACLAYARDH